MNTAARRPSRAAAIATFVGLPPTALVKPPALCQSAPSFSSGRLTTALAVSIYFAGVMIETAGIALVAAYGALVLGSAIAVLGVAIATFGYSRWPESELSVSRVALMTEYLPIRRGR